MFYEQSVSKSPALFLKKRNLHFSTLNLQQKTPGDTWRQSRLGPCSLLKKKNPEKQNWETNFIYTAQSTTSYYKPNTWMHQKKQHALNKSLKTEAGRTDWRDSELQHPSLQSNCNHGYKLRKITSWHILSPSFHVRTKENRDVGKC